MSSADRDKIADEFIDLALECEALSLGDFTLKSGRKSPYFMDVSKISEAGPAKRLGVMYVELAKRAGHAEGTLIGLAYKGIPLAAIAAAATDDMNDADFSYGYVRMMRKNESEKESQLGGNFIPNKATLLLDDVLTAGTAAKEGREVCGRCGWPPHKLLVAFDRMERVSDDDARTASKMLEEDGLTVCSLANVEDLLRADLEPDTKKRISKHLVKYGAKNVPAPS